MTQLKQTPLFSRHEALGAKIADFGGWAMPIEYQGVVAEHTAGGHRRYDLGKLRPERLRAEDEAKRRTVAYARVSSSDQKDDLERQKQVLERYCARQGWTFEVIADLGSGMNSRSRKNQKLLDGVRAAVEHAAC